MAGGGEELDPGKEFLEEDVAHPQQIGGQRRGCPDYFLSPWYRRYFSLDRIPVWSPHA